MIFTKFEKTSNLSLQVQDLCAVFDSWYFSKWNYKEVIVRPYVTFFRVYEI